MAGKTESSHKLELSEYDDQKIVFQWIRKMSVLDSRYLNVFAIPNAAKRSFKLASMLKAQGMSAGFPDIAVLVPVQPYYGLFIELKVGKNKPSDTQLVWMGRLNAMGYLALPIWGADATIETITKYMGRK